MTSDEYQIISIFSDPSSESFYEFYKETMNNINLRQGARNITIKLEKI